MITLVIVLAVSAVITRVSYAAFTVEKSTQSNVLTFGDLAMTICTTSNCDVNGTKLSNTIGTYTFKDSNNLDATGYVPFYPISDPNAQTFPTGWEGLSPFRFVLKNNGDTDLYMSLHLSAIYNGDYYLNSSSSGTTYYNGSSYDSSSAKTDSNVTKSETFNETYSSPIWYTSDYAKYFKVALVEEGTDSPLVQSLFTILNNERDAVSGGKITGNILMQSGEERTYSLYIWLSQEAMQSQEASVNTNSVIGSYLVTQLIAKGEYIPE